MHTDIFPVTVAAALKNTQLPRFLVIRGWLRSIRQSKNLAFLSIYDGSQSVALQAVCDYEKIDPACLAELSTGCAVRVEGQLVASPKAQQAAELQVEKIEMIGSCDADAYPLQKKEHTLEFLRSVPHLRARTHTQGAVLRIRHILCMATHHFFSKHGFFYNHTPIITSNDCEGAGEMFEVVRRFPDGTPFFHEKAYLTVSGQLHGEALAYGLGRIYTLGPTFRAENSNTARHAAEFWMVEPEAAFFTAEDNQKLAIAYLKHGINDVLTHAEEDVHMLGKLHDPQLLKRLENLVEQSFVTISYTQAVDILRKEHPDSQALVWGEDLSTPQERFLTEEIYKKPVVVIDYPKSLKPFYMYQNEDGKTVGAMDILVPKIGEIIGGSQREHRLERLSASMQAMELDEAHYGWYIEMNRFGGVPHAGFGLGLERWVMLCTGISNIRDVIPFPRTPGHIQL